jgi:hypothetical protein
MHKCSIPGLFHLKHDMDRAMTKAFEKEVPVGSEGITEQVQWEVPQPPNPRPWVEVIQGWSAHLTGTGHSSQRMEQPRQYS